ncbi:Predicted flavoprotein CzcO associated with the cation diffusion facilitator CzcD [Nocardia amikacinitolerans]|uniref:Predicted flavoprotein CzcO associated with the cation diffusion facilitator CzcD n=1 Tax=Nocardia amikacinitolerans TaxID=756689 RepID=A0A285LX21_9NOCA|nr:NAD(P)/FAD-dependent oxidoreductase [Nocardia amikacinitolerans]SNY89479.1 Predicted flavoprotein CzcO associated with the cation diffusion facilitator CzcD [Nocardia amikacinitolerans]
MELNGLAEVDVVIVGAGISGIAAAADLQRNCPDKSFVVLEMRESVGGTWDLFRYPGIRSDSDMFTLGYGFKPWTAPEAIASGEAIKNYLRETAAEFGITEKIRFGTRLIAASWSSADNIWTLTLHDKDGETRLRCRFLHLATGYYSYRGGFNPELPGEESFEGRVVHPQEWPDDLDYRNKNVAVIGSGATAVTLIPSLAGETAKVTMVQRSPTYVYIAPVVDPEAERLREEVGPEDAFRQIRLRNLYAQQETYRQARQYPEEFKKTIFDAIDEVVGVEVREAHFTPSYEPWDQRVCVVPGGDLFEAIRDGSADVVTGHIERLTPAGIAMQDGTHVDADIVVKATGLNLVLGGEATFDVDGEIVDFGRCWTYKGLAFSGVPNMTYAFGFVNSSWTLRIEVVDDFLCRVLRHMDEIGAARVTPTLAPGDDDMPRLPYSAGVTSGYMQRAARRMPAQGDREPWLNPQNYDETVRLLESVDDGVLRYV